MNRGCSNRAVACRILRFLLVGGLVIAGDQWTKQWALANLSPLYARTVMDGFFSLTLVMNSGVAFGVFSGIDSAVKTNLLLVLSGITVILIVAYGLYENHLEKLARWALPLIVGGAIGNMIDRWRYHKVVDFLDFYWHGHHWPAFNLADSAITIGVALILLGNLCSHNQQ